MAGSPQRTRVFISYSHNDARYLKRLQQHLSYYERNNLIDYWDDTKLAVGDDWERKIAEAIEYARVCILLVSADYLASTYVTDKELPQMLACAKNEAALICTVVLSPCGFMRTALSQFQAINDASRPLSGMTRHQKENVWHSLAEKVADTLSGAQPADTAPPSMQSQPNGQNRTQPSVPRPANMSIEEALARGENLIKDGKYAEAAVLLAGPVRLTPENLRAWALYEKALRQRAQDRPRERAKPATEGDRERLARGLTIVRTYTDQLKPQHRLLDRPLPPPSGNADGIIRNWLMDAQALLGKLLELREAVIGEKTRPEVAVLEARMAIRDTVTSLRPGVRMISKAPAHLVGPNAELGQACVACMDMIEELAVLLREPDGSAVTMRHVR